MTKIAPKLHQIDSLNQSHFEAFQFLAQIPIFQYNPNPNPNSNTSPLITSGLIQFGVPIVFFRSPFNPVTFLAQPKSAILQIPCLSTKTFAPLMSRWITWLMWRCSRAFKICHVYVLILWNMEIHKKNDWTRTKIGRQIACTEITGNMHQKPEICTKNRKFTEKARKMYRKSPKMPPQLCRTHSGTTTLTNFLKFLPKSTWLCPPAAPYTGSSNWPTTLLQHTP